MYIKVVELKSPYLVAKDYFKFIKFREKLKIITFTITNVIECMENE